MKKIYGYAWVVTKKGNFWGVGEQGKWLKCEVLGTRDHQYTRSYLVKFADGTIDHFPRLYTNDPTI